MSSDKQELSCLHTHTNFCDGKTDVEAMCEAAFSKGFVSLGFSSHAPITKKTGLETNWHIKDQNLGEYIDAIEKAKKRWDGKLTVYSGLEVDYIAGYCGPSDADIQALPLDFIIGSVHYLISPKSGEPFNIDEYPDGFSNVLEEFGHDGRALCEMYYDTYSSMIQGGGCDILGHLDLIKKNNGRYGFFSPGESWYKERLEKTADLIAGSGMPVVEVNTGAMIRGYITEPYPSSDMLVLLKERNVPLVLNADAHDTGFLGGCYNEARQFMRGAGYSAMVLFEGRENGKAVWREVPLL